MSTVSLPTVIESLIDSHERAIERHTNAIHAIEHAMRELNVPSHIGPLCDAIGVLSVERDRCRNERERWIAQRA